MVTKFKLYAIRMGDHIELRKASSPPVAKISKLTKTYVGINVIDKQVPTKTVLKQVFYIGGKVLGVCKYRHFQLGSKAFGLGSLERDKIMEIPRGFKNELLKVCL